MPRIFRLVPLLALFLMPESAYAADPAPTFWQDIRPVMRRHCTVCHRENKLREVEVSAGLALDSYENLRKTGKQPSVVPGQPDKSMLVTLLTEKNLRRRMPLDAEPLEAETIELIRRWVAAGALEGDKPDEPDEIELATTAPVRVRKLPVELGLGINAPSQVGSGPLSLALPVGPLPPVAAVAFSPDGKQLAVGIYGRVTVWDLASAQPTHVITQVLGAVNDLKYSPKGDILAVSGGLPSARGDLRLFDTKSWELIASLGGHLDSVSMVSFSPDGKQILSASFDKTVRLWDIASQKPLHTFTGHSDFVYAVEFSPQGDWYATASKDRTARIIDAKTGESKITLGGMNEEVTAVAVSADGKQVVTSGHEPQLHWWNPETGERVRRQGGHRIATHELAFDGKSSVLLSGGNDASIKTWNPANGAAKATLNVGSDVFAVAVDNQGQLAAAGAADGMVRLFDLNSGQLRLTLWNGPSDDPIGNWIAVTPSGHMTSSQGLLDKANWKAGGKAVKDAKSLAVLNNSELAAKAAQGEKVPDPFGK